MSLATATKVRHAFKQYLFIYQDARLEKHCNELLSKSDAYLASHYKIELFKVYRRFQNPLMETIHQLAIACDWDQVFFPGYLASLDPETQASLV